MAATRIQRPPARAITPRIAAAAIRSSAPISTGLSFTGSEHIPPTGRGHGGELKGAFKRKHEAQQAIDEAYGLSDRPDTLGEYAAAWTDRHPRSERTNDHRIGRVLNVEIEGVALRDWPLRELRRRHALALVDLCFAPEVGQPPAPSASCALSQRSPMK